MEKILNVAQFIIDEYQKITKTKIDEMKLHKLLYFAQRESFAITGEPLFAEELEGWKHGPVSREVRCNFDEGEIACKTDKIFDDAAYIVRNVIFTYGALSSWRLRDMSHEDISWINTRSGLSADENGNKVLDLEDIKKDAEKVRPYDHVWDMYYDEFDDAKVM